MLMTKKWSENKPLSSVFVIMFCVDVDGDDSSIEHGFYQNIIINNDSVLLYYNKNYSPW